MRWPLALALTLAACSEAPSDETPSGAVRMFVDAMERAERDPDALREAYALLAAPTRRALQRRAHLAASLGGREFEPWEMLVSGRFRRTFAIGEGTGAMREAIDGDSATVTVREQNGSRVARVPLVREGGRWRIVIELPDPRGRSDASAPPR